MVAAGTVVVGASAAPARNPIPDSIDERPSRISVASTRHSAQWNKLSPRLLKARQVTWHFARDIRLAAVSLHQGGIAIPLALLNYLFGVMHLKPNIFNPGQFGLVNVISIKKDNYPINWSQGLRQVDTQYN